MTDTMSPEKRKEIMRANRSCNTKPEIVVRRLIHSLGYRYRIHDKQLPGVPDIVFSSRLKLIFIHGCFWHSHEKCKNWRPPKSNQSYWRQKLLKNKKRDMENMEKLKEIGWKCLIIWECQLGDEGHLRSAIVEFLGPTKWEK